MQSHVGFPHRKSIRLSGYDYAQEGWYYVTICTENKRSLFGEIIHEEMQLNIVGEMILHYWNLLPIQYQHVSLDVFVIMPNHIHGILILHGVGAPLVGAHNNGGNFVLSDTQRAGTRPAPTIGEIIGGFKSISTNAYIRNVTEHGWPRFEKRLWQRNYYEHIIRNEKDLQRIQEYILTNPAHWEKDELFMAR